MTGSLQPDSVAFRSTATKQGLKDRSHSRLFECKDPPSGETASRLRQQTAPLADASLRDQRPAGQVDLRRQVESNWSWNSALHLPSPARRKARSAYLECIGSASPGGWVNFP